MGKKLTTKEFIKRSKHIHNNYFDYSKSVYKTSLSYIDIKCPVHGVFTTKPNWHLNGQGCRKCSDETKFQKRRLSTDEFVYRSKQIHGDRYDYSKTEYINCRTKVNIICEKHGEFKQKPPHHFNGSGCPLCNSSKGELLIEVFLIQKNIMYLREYKFSDCINKRELPFDFYLPNHNLCIEYDGRQHFEVIDHFGGLSNYRYVVNNDNIKENYCTKNNIKLIRINFKESVLEKLDHWFCISNQ